MSENLTSEQKAINHDTWRHIHRVQTLLLSMCQRLQQRALQHDQSKLVSPEVELFTEYTAKLAAVTYGSPEYEAFRKAMGPALAHHYANNSHHPEHYARGINDMNLLDLLEMFCDWKAASERHNDGNIRKSIATNATRFNMTAQLQQIFENSISLLD